MLAPNHRHPRHQDEAWAPLYRWLENTGPPWEDAWQSQSAPEQSGDIASTLAHLSVAPSADLLSATNLKLLEIGMTRLQDKISIHHILAHTPADEAIFQGIINLAKWNIDRDQAVMGKIAVDRALKFLAKYKQTGGKKFAVEFLDKRIIFTIRDDLESAGLRAAVNEPLLATSLPRDPYSTLTLVTPNICYGLSLSKFTDRQQELIAKFADQYMVCPPLVSAFLITAHSDRPASIIDSDVQAARNATALLCAQRQINVLAHYFNDIDTADKLSWVYSLTMTTSEARLNLHFIETGRHKPYYHMHRLRTYSLENIDDIKTLRRNIWNVLEYGLQYRQQHVINTLGLLDDKVEGYDKKAEN